MSLPTTTIGDDLQDLMGDNSPLQYMADRHLAMYLANVQNSNPILDISAIISYYNNFWRLGSATSGTDSYVQNHTSSLMFFVLATGALHDDENSKEWVEKWGALALSTLINIAGRSGANKRRQENQDHPHNENPGVFPNYTQIDF
jgi:hypothetical protein